MQDLVLALDFGGTKHAAALVERGTWQWRAYERIPAPPDANAERDIAAVLDLARRLLGGTEGQLRAVGVSFGGPVDAPRGVVRLSHHVPGWERLPLAAVLERELGVPAAIDNDANAGALGEQRFGAGRGVESLLYVTVSTGVGGGWVLGGRVWRGVSGMAGEIGHVSVDPQGPACVCGRRGCVEAFACGPAIARAAAERLAADPAQPSSLRALAAPAAADVAAAAASGDSLAREVLLAAARALGTGIGAALSLVDPGLVVLGGGVTKAGELWWDAVRAAARQATLPEVEAAIIPATLGDDAPLWGALALAEDALAGT